MRIRDAAMAALFVVGCSGQAQRAEPQPQAAVGTVAMPVFQASPPLSQIASQVQRGELAPWSLTASDGSGLVLTKVDARAVFHGPLAFTELRLSFHNPEPRVREGRFAIALPANAAVSRFAMQNDGQWMEAELVEKQRARRAYEDFLHRRQDPALLEKAAGNEFTARVFPIPANGDKHLVISFSQELPGARYVLPMRGLPQVAQVDVALGVLAADGTRTTQRLAQRDWRPDHDFVSSAPLAAEAIGSGALVAAQLEVLDARGAMPPADPPRALTVLLDTSASRALGFDALIANTSRLIAALRATHGDALPLQVVAFDQVSEPIYSGAASGWGAAQEAALRTRGAAGASDLGQALGWLASHAPHARVVVIGDGVVTAGVGGDELFARAKQLPGVERIDIVLAGGLRDDALASSLSRAAARPGGVFDLDAGNGADSVATGLAEALLTDVAIEVPGAVWSAPQRLAAVRPGSRVMVYARMARPGQAITAVVNGHRRALRVVGAAPALVERALAASEITELEAQLAAAPAEARAALAATITQRSLAARVVSSQTSLLVLESEADYARFGIDRRALADILEVGPDGALVQRSRTQLAIGPSPGPSPKPPQTTPVAKRPQAPRDAALDGRKLAESASAPDPRVATGAPAAEPAPSLADDRASNEPEDVARVEGVEGGVAGGLVGGEVSGSSGRAAGPAQALPTAPPPPPPPPPPHEMAARSEADRADATAAYLALEERRAQLTGRGEPARRALAVRRPRPGDVDRDGTADRRGPVWPQPHAPAALRGPLAGIMAAVRSDAALAEARAWHAREPGDVLALIALGETLEARDQDVAAARIYGSIIDLFPGRADLRRFAGERLERIGGDARALAVDTYRRAVADRPDHLTGHRLLAYALLRADQPAAAFAAILAGLSREYPAGRFAGGERTLREDATLIGAAYAAAVPSAREQIRGDLARAGLAIASAPSTRFVLYWETDANDVDFHIQDARGGHAWYSNLRLPSGGELFADVTTGYGPECFAIPGVAKAGPYKLSLDYYAQGPMGYGMGLLQIVRHDGKGKLVFEDRPFVIMNDHAYVDLGSYRP